MADAVLSHLKVVGCSAARLGGKQAKHVVIMAGDALAATLEFTAPLKPSPQTVKDHHLVPKGAAGIDGGYIADVKIAACEIVPDEWPHGHWSMRVKRRLRARFDLDGPANVVVSCGGGSGIPEKQALAIWIVDIKLHAPTVGGQARRADRLPQESFYLLQ